MCGLDSNIIIFHCFFFVLVFDVYKNIAGCDIEESICAEFTGNLEALLVAVGKKNAINKVEY